MSLPSKFHQFDDSSFDTQEDDDRVAYDWIKIQPKRTFNKADNDIIFESPPSMLDGARSSLFFLHHSYLQVPLRIVHEDGTQIASHEVVMVINNAVSKFRKIKFEIADRTLTEISDFNWFVQDCMNKGLFTKKYSDAVLSDDMDYLPDKERFCKELYPYDATDGNYGSYFAQGLFSKPVKCTVRFLSYNIAPSHELTIEIVDNNFDIHTGQVNNFYSMQWYVVFTGNNVNSNYVSKPFLISSDVLIAGKRRFNIIAADNNANRWINPVDGTLFGGVGGDDNYAGFSNTFTTEIMLFPNIDLPTLERSEAAKRSEKYHNSQISVKRLPLRLMNFLPYNIADKIMTGFDWRLTLEFESDDVCLFHNKGSAVKYKLEVCDTPYLMLCVPRLSEPRNSQFLQYMRSGQKVLKYNKYQTDFKPFQNNSNGSIDIFNISAKATQVFVAFHDETYGPKLKNQAFNPLIFDNLNVTNINAVIQLNTYPNNADGQKQVFIKPTTFTNLNGQNTHFSYMNFLDTYGKLFDYESDGVCEITHSYWQDTPLFCFDLESQNYNKAFVDAQNISLKIEWQLESAKTYTIYVLTVMDKKCILDMSLGRGQLL